jgi:hypothetical protein
MKDDCPGLAKKAPDLPESGKGQLTFYKGRVILWEPPVVERLSEKVRQKRFVVWLLSKVAMQVQEKRLLPRS